MSKLDGGYRRWTGRPTGIWQRRWVITSVGLKLCLESKLLRGVIGIVWSSTLFFMGVLFFTGQLTSPDSTLISFVGERLGDSFLQLANGLASWVLLYPELCVDGVFRVIYYVACQIYLLGSFMAIALFVAKLIAHDLASQAIVIYNSKALSRFDYFIGKFGIVFLLLGAIWLVPILSLWTFGNMMSPDWTFFVYSFKALLKALSVAAVSMVSLSLAAMAVSALARRTSVAVSLWVLIWILSGLVGMTAKVVYSAGGYISLMACLKDFIWASFRLDLVWENATNMLPFFNLILKDVPRDFPEELSLGPAGVVVPLACLVLYGAVSCLILKLRTKSQ